MGVDAAISLLLALLSHSAEISALIARARAEGREELTADEWTTVIGASDRARQALLEAIEKAESEGR